MVFPWFSHGFPLVFPWFSPGFPMVFPWFSHGFSRGSPELWAIPRGPQGTVRSSRANRLRLGPHPTDDIVEEKTGRLRHVKTWCFSGNWWDMYAYIYINTYIYICLYIPGWWFQPNPSEKWWSSSVGMIFHSQYDGKVNKSCSKPPTRYVI